MKKGKIKDLSAKRSEILESFGKLYNRITSECCAQMLVQSDLLFRSGEILVCNRTLEIPIRDCFAKQLNRQLQDARLVEVHLFKDLNFGDYVDGRINRYMGDLYRLSHSVSNNTLLQSARENLKKIGYSSVRVVNPAKYFTDCSPLETINL